MVGLKKCFKGIIVKLLITALLLGGNAAFPARAETTVYFQDDFNSYSELCAKNKRVLNYLRYFGLCKIIFADFSPDTTYEYGAIKIINVEETSDSDIVVGWLYGCLDFRVKVNLYFPKGIGGLLNKYFDGEMLQKEVHELLTSFGKV